MTTIGPQPYKQIFQFLGNFSSDQKHTMKQVGVKNVLKKIVQYKVEHFNDAHMLLFSN